MKWEKVGVVGVDAGLIMVGDPCYHADGKRPKALGKDWQDFCHKLRDSKFDQNNSLQLDYDMGHAGLGVVVSSGYGDGVYDVMVKKNSEGRVVALKVEFSDMETEF